jgi:hypothetical protein
MPTHADVFEVVNFALSLCGRLCRYTRHSILLALLVQKYMLHSCCEHRAAMSFVWPPCWHTRSSVYLLYWYRYDAEGDVRAW